MCFNDPYIKDLVHSVTLSDVTCNVRRGGAEGKSVTHWVESGP